MESGYLKIHEFWETLFPQFQNNAEFLYYFLDIVFVMVFIKIILSLPKLLLNDSKRVL